MGDELFPKKDGQMLTSDIDYVDVWRVRTHTLCFNVHWNHQSSIACLKNVKNQNQNAKIVITTT